jgi:hypothetical protein
LLGAAEFLALVIAVAAAAAAATRFNEGIAKSLLASPSKATAQSLKHFQQ